MNRTFVVLGIVLLIAGLASFSVLYFTTLIGGETHGHTVTFGSLALAVLGALIAVGGVMMGKPGAAAGGQFKCAQCGAVFGSQTALDQHTRDKHGKR